MAEGHMAQLKAKSQALALELEKAQEAERREQVMVEARHIAEKEARRLTQDAARTTLAEQARRTKLLRLQANLQEARRNLQTAEDAFFGEVIQYDPHPPSIQPPTIPTTIKPSEQHSSGACKLDNVPPTTQPTPPAALKPSEPTVQPTVQPTGDTRLTRRPPPPPPHTRLTVTPAGLRYIPSAIGVEAGGATLTTDRTTTSTMQDPV